MALGAPRESPPAAEGPGEPLAIIAAGGPVAARMADAVRRSGRPVIVLGHKGMAEAEIKRFPHAWIWLG